ncbi:MAG: GNAT family N-acetyltransferase [Oscillospiraceae bacterium]|jgi:RimJ/RimL family protein N-acetyltransferase|nr:GNAT family N-acetyltransferase [Oscillospiraceae bacterium]
MMTEVQPADFPRLLPLFVDNPRHLMAVSALNGLVEARAFADNPARPAAALVLLSRVGLLFVAGQAQAALPEALRGFRGWYEVSDPPPAWHPALAAWSIKSRALARYQMNPPPAFDRALLQRLATPPEGYTLHPYDAALVEKALSEEWSKDQIDCFGTAEAFLADGLGVALLQGDALVSGCSSFCRHADGYEIQVDTRADRQRQGLATCVSAAFILRCLDLGWMPHWDAANVASLRLAERLGFVLDRAYTAWDLEG